MAVNIVAGVVVVGADLPAWRRRTGIENWNRYAAVNDEFIPMHMEDGPAIASGNLQGAFGMGNLRFAYLLNALRDWAGDEVEILAVGCQFRAINQKDELLSVVGSVTHVRRDGLGTEVELTMNVVNEAGLKTAPGYGRIRIPADAEAPLNALRSGEGLTDPLNWPGNADPEVLAAADDPLASEAMRSTRGRWGEPRTARPVSESDIRRWAIAVYWPEEPPPLFWDSAYAAKTRWNGIVAPPDFNPFTWPVPFDPEGPNVLSLTILPGTLGMNGGCSEVYGVPIRAGDVITKRRRLLGWRKREGRFGPTFYLHNEERWENQEGEFVKSRFGTGVRYWPP